MKIKITHGNNTIDYDLNRDQSLILSLESICLAFTISDNATDFTLQLASNNHYLNQGVRC